MGGRGGSSGSKGIGGVGLDVRITAKRHGIISRDTEIRIIIRQGWEEWRSQLHKT